MTEQIRINELSKLFQDIHDDQVAKIKANAADENRLLTKLTIYCFALPALTTLFIGFAYCLVEDAGNREIIATVAYILMAIVSFFYIYVFYKFWKMIFYKKPYGMLLENFERNALTDLPHYKRLYEFSIEELQYLRLQLEFESRAVLQRITSFIGNVGGIGLLPGVIAIYYMFVEKGGLQQNSIAFAIVVANMILYLFGFLAVNLKPIIDRTIALLDMVIQNKKEEVDLSKR